MLFHGQDVPEGTIGELVRRRAALADKPFLTIDGEIITFEQLDERSTKIAAGLQASGLHKGDVVATFMYNSVMHVLLWMAAAKIGAIWAPINVSSRSADLEYTLIDTAARLAVVDSSLVEVYEEPRAAIRASLPHLLEFVDAPEPLHGLASVAVLESHDHEVDHVDIAPTDAACITYTGGSTGMPKGVLLPHLMYISCGMRYVQLTSATEGDTHYSSGQLCHIGGQQLGIIGPLYAGIPTTLDKWFSASRYWERVRKADASIIDPPGPMIAAVAAQPESATDRHHRVRMSIGTGSGQISGEARETFIGRYGVPLFEVYAQTETGILFCSETPRSKRQGSCGHPDEMGWAEIRVVDELGQPLPPGTEGRMVLRPREGSAFMLGYHGKPEATVASWRTLWFNTGDLGRFDDDGFLYFCGREAHWIRRRGENVAAFEVEQIIGAHPAVESCAVVGVPSDLAEEDIKAYLQLRPGIELDPSEIIDWCTERLSYFKVPRYIEFVDEFPRTVTKKEIQRHILRDRGIGSAWDAGVRRPQHKGIA
jgi:carnitine-CoA ligase